MLDSVVVPGTDLAVGISTGFLLAKAGGWLRRNVELEGELRVRGRVRRPSRRDDADREGSHGRAQP